MAPFGGNGGLIGARRLPGGGVAPGVWTLDEQATLQRAGQWVSDGFRSSVSLHLPFNGANNSTTFTDSSPFAHTITTFGDAKISTAQSRFGGASGLFDGTGDYLTCPNTSGAFNLGSGDFTMEAWIYLANVTGNKVIASMWPTDSTASFRLLALDNIINLGWRTSTGSFAGASGGTLVATTWTYVRVVRVGSFVYVYQDNVLVGLAPISGSIADGASTLSVGRNEFSNTWFWNGHIDDLRITKGVARVNPNVLAPQVALPTN